MAIGANTTAPMAASVPLPTAHTAEGTCLCDAACDSGSSHPRVGDLRLDLQYFPYVIYRTDPIAFSVLYASRTDRLPTKCEQ
jgi:hypothetical protein